MEMEPYFDPSKVIVRKIDKKMAENMVVTYHYSHKWSLCKIAYGIFYLTGKQMPFFDMPEEKFIGCIVFGQPVGRSAAKSISDLIKIHDVFELVRLYCHDGYGKNIESYCIAKSLKLLKQDFPHLKTVISYADNEAGHRGVIYQASGFYYQGNSEIALMPNYSISLVGSPYKWIHSRTAFATFGSHNVEHLKKKIGHTFYRKKEAKKHRYVYLLGNKLEKKKILSNLKHPFLPFPKRLTWKEEIEEVKVDNLIENPFFR